LPQDHLLGALGSHLLLRRIAAIAVRPSSLDSDGTILYFQSLLHRPVGFCGLEKGPRPLSLIILRPENGHGGAPFPSILLESSSECVGYPIVLRRDCGLCGAPPFLDSHGTILYLLFTLRLASRPKWFGKAAMAARLLSTSFLTSKPIIYLPT